MAGLAGTYEQKATYTADGQLASTTYPAAGGLRKETVTTQYDDDTSVAEWMGGGFGWGAYVASSRTDVFGRLSYLDLGNTYGTVVSYGYEIGTSRLQSVKLDRERIGGTELDLTYSYDDAGNVLSVKDRPTSTGRAADRQCYEYDALRRLTEAWTPASGNCGLARSIPALGGAAPYWSSFEYDALGNRTDETYRTRGVAGDVDGGQTTTRDYSYEGTRDLNADGDTTDVGEFAGPHAVTSITTDGPSGTTGTAFTYDNAGRTLTQTQDSDYLTSAVSLGWDQESELASTSTATTVYAEPEPGSGDDDTDGDQSSGTGPDRGTGTTTTAGGRNLYSAEGDRLVRTAPDGAVTVYLGGQEITKAANGTVTGARYYSFGGQTVAMRTANGLGGVTSLINDPHGTPLASVHNTNWTTTSVDKHYTLPFGQQRGGVSAPGDHEFLGKVRDEATGLTLVGARWYDETVGKFLSVDPLMDLSDPQQWNAYAYAGNNPTTWTDPSGLAYARDGAGSCGCTPTSGWNHPGEAKDDAGTESAADGVVDKQWDPLDLGEILQYAFDAVGAQVTGALHGVADQAQFLTGYASSCVTQHPVLTGDWGNAFGYGVNCTSPQGAIASKMANDTVEGTKATYDEISTDVKEKNTNKLIGEGAVYLTEAVLARRIAPAKPVPANARVTTSVADGLCSFAGATLVLMADGSHKPIKDVEVGDEVIATDPETGERAAMPVTHVWVHRDDLFEFEVDGELIITTEDHPFWSITDQQWEGTRDLGVGEHVLSADGRALAVTREVDLGTREAGAAYNLTVAGLHTYHVSEDDVLVHNAGGEWFPDRPLPRDAYGNPVPDSEYPHTQLGQKPGRRGSYPQAREFGYDGELVRDIDFTDHGRPSNHDNPHQHDWVDNATGGTKSRGPAVPLEMPCKG